MTASKKSQRPVGRVTPKNSKSNKNEKQKPRAPAQLSVGVAGDQRLAENVIIEVLAAARRCGLEPPIVQVVRQPRVGPKVRLQSGHKSRSG